MKHNVDELFIERYNKYVNLPTGIDIYNNYLQNVKENGKEFYDVPLYMQTNEMILAAIESSSPLFLMTRKELDNYISQEWAQYRDKHKTEMPNDFQDRHLRDLYYIIDCKNQGSRFGLEANDRFESNRLYTFFDFFSEVAAHYGGMDTVCYLYLYRGLALPIIIKGDVKQYYKLLYDKEASTISRHQISSIEYTELRTDLNDKLEKYYSRCLESFPYLEEYSWPNLTTDEDSITLLNNGRFYDSFETIHQNNAVFDITCSALMSLDKNITEYQIPETVYELMPKCFANCDNLVKVIFHSCLSKIPAAAFLNCPNLKAVDLSLDYYNVDVESAAFCNCYKLSDIDFSKISIDNAELCFSFCNKIEDISQIAGFSNSLGFNFYHCEAIKFLPPDLYGANVYDFAFCSSVCEIVLSWQKVPEGLCYLCKNLESVRFKSVSYSVKVGEYSFAYCAINELDTCLAALETSENSFIGCNNLHILKIGHDKDFGTKILQDSFSDISPIEIKWCDKSGRICSTEKLSEFIERKLQNEKKQEELKYRCAIKVKDMIINIMKASPNSTPSIERLGALYTEKGNILGSCMSYILKENVCTWEEFLVLAKFFKGCMAYARIQGPNEVATCARIALISWAKSSAIKSFMMAPLHQKMGTIEVMYSIIRASYDNVDRPSQKWVLSYDLLNTYFSYIENLTSKNCSAEELQFKRSYLSLHNTERISYLIEYHLLRHIVSFYTKSSTKCSELIAYQERMEQILNHVNSFGSVTQQFIKSLSYKCWLDFINEDIIGEYEDFGYEQYDMIYSFHYDSNEKLIYCKIDEIWEDENPEPETYECSHHYDYDYDEERTAPGYGRYKGSYAQDEMGYSDEEIDILFDGDPDAYWNID